MAPNLNRRRLLAGAAGLGAVAGLGLGGLRLLEGQAPGDLLLGARDDAAGRHYVRAFTADGGSRFELEVPFRGHGFAVRPDRRRAVLFGRRPRPQAAELDLLEGRLLRVIEAQPGRHFYGHGCYSPDGGLLYATENAYEAGEGRIGVRDGETLRWLGELPSHGIGPHDLHLLADGRTLVVANGGILTHPLYERRKLNLDTMAPSLSYLDAASGRLLADFRLPDHQLSIRHLYLSPGDDVAVALQYQGPPGRAQPLLALQPAGGELALLAGPPAELAALNDYAADVCISAPAGVVALTGPRGNRVSFWGLADRRYRGALVLAEPSAIALTADGRCFVVTGADGAGYRIAADRLEVEAILAARQPGLLWDNHMIRV